MFSGTLRVRDRVRFGRDGEAKVTALAVFERGAGGAAAVGLGRRDREALGPCATSGSATAIGEAGPRRRAHEFPPPTLESVVEPADPDDAARLRAALAQLDEQDPLINVRQDEAQRALASRSTARCRRR